MKIVYRALHVSGLPCILLYRACIVSYRIMRESYRIVRVSYPIVRVSYRIVYHVKNNVVGTVNAHMMHQTWYRMSFTW
jgi:hypothetical protein